MIIAWAEFDINPSDVNFSYASSKQHTYEVAEFIFFLNMQPTKTNGALPGSSLSHLQGSTPMV